MSHAAQLEGEIERLKGKIESDPDGDRMLELARQMREDHGKVQEALRYAEISEEDRRKLLRIVRSRS